MVAELERVWGKLPFESAVVCGQRAGAAPVDAVDLRAVAGADTSASSPRWAPRSTSTACSTATEADVRVRGRLDRLERDEAGRLVVVDIKTGKTPGQQGRRAASRAAGDVSAGHRRRRFCRRGIRPGGGRLVYLGKAGDGRADRAAAGPADPGGPRRSGASWSARRRRPPQGPQFLARVNDGCAHCPVRQSCPAQAAADGSATS